MGMSMGRTAALSATLATALSAVAGCGEPGGAVNYRRGQEQPAAKAAAPVRFAADAAPAQALVAGEAPAAAAPANNLAAMGRKIIFTGTLAVVTRDFAVAESRVRSIVSARKGFVADA
ncbi:MAG TPA: hypothetical protein VNC50_15705, partial [Planctomycetia bacterium]|nr:hypothetical protein [Planctomycetia bacterium]